MTAYLVHVEVVPRADGYWIEATVDGAPRPGCDPIGPFERFGEAVLAAEDLRTMLLSVEGNKDIGKLN